jgi:hypothetical protein
MGFLTEKRRELLTGEYSGDEDAEYSIRHRTKRSAESSLDDLITVAQSDEIDNQSVFDERKIEQLLLAIIGPEEEVTPRWERDDLTEHAIENDHRMKVHNTIKMVYERFYAPFYQYEEPESPIELKAMERDLNPVEKPGVED